MYTSKTYHVVSDSVENNKRRAHLWHNDTTAMTRSNMREVKEQFKALQVAIDEEKKIAGIHWKGKKER